MFPKLCLFILYTSVSGAVTAQHPFKHWTEAVQSRYSSKQPIINYHLRVDTNNLSVYSIRMQIRNVPDTFRVAMVAHPEYDDRYWRFIEQMRVETPAGKGSVQRIDSALWQVVAKGDEAVLEYQLRLPPLEEPQRAAWYPFLSSSGGLAGGPHCFLYVVGATLGPSHVSFDIPNGWKIATGLEPTPDPYTFYASSTAVLVDCPVLLGRFASSLFMVDGVPHQLAYYTAGDAKIDTAKLVHVVHRLAEEALALFGRLPYRAYTFLFFDDAYGALEHANSVTIGAPARLLEEDFSEVLTETAHEYFHAWNLVRIRPAERTDVDYRTPPLSKVLWFSEGLTMHYADLLLRRAKLPTPEASRIEHITGLLNRYFDSDVYTTYSAERISLAENGPAGMLGDYVVSPHLQGELLGIMLDLVIREATHDTRSMDDVMKKMLEDFSGQKGFTSRDVEKTIQAVCRCDVHPFFQDYIVGAKQIDFNRYLKLIGLEYAVQYLTSTNEEGKPLPDLRIWAWTRPGEDTLRAGIGTPLSCWAKAGLHTGDPLVSINNQPIIPGAEGGKSFWQTLRSAKIGDKISVSILRSGRVVKIVVPVSEFKHPDVSIRKLANLAPQQQERYGRWSAGK